MMNYRTQALLVGAFFAGVISSPLIARMVTPPLLAGEETSSPYQEQVEPQPYAAIRMRVLQGIEEFGERHPAAMEGFSQLNRAAMEPGALDAKTKELLCVVIGVTNRCDACIAFHTNGALEAGATEEEVMEALGVAVMMGGGPSLAYATHVLEAMDEFAKPEG
jgi:AhpD family alkylhydroperoxidase